MKGVRVFGHDDHDDKQDDTTVSPQPADGSQVPDVSAGAGNDSGVAPIEPTAAPEPSGTPTLPDNSDNDSSSSGDSSDSNTVANSGDLTASSSSDTVSPTPAASTASNEELLELKKQTIEELSPLLSHLDQSPDEKFRTTMMMIQATDSSSLIKDAHEAAQKIPDEKARAQALLDIVNEINYFTHAGESDTDSDQPIEE